ncbi:hypothetical protein V8C26DRAFT_252319 [Trichoderma gracile]
MQPSSNLRPALWQLNWLDVILILVDLAAGVLLQRLNLWLPRDAPEPFSHKAKGQVSASPRTPPAKQPSRSRGHPSQISLMLQNRAFSRARPKDCMDQPDTAYSTGRYTGKLGIAIASKHYCRAAPKRASIR